MKEKLGELQNENKNVSIYSCDDIDKIFVRKTACC